MKARVSVAVVGSRDYPDAPRRVLQRLKTLKADFPDVHFHIISGGAAGVDAAAVRAAKRLRMSYTVFDADWDGLGRRAGLERNSLMVDAADRVIAFWDFESAGTADTIRKGLVEGMHTEVWDQDFEPAGPRARVLLVGDQLELV